MSAPVDVLAVIIATLDRISEPPQRFEAFLIRNVVGLVCGCVMLMAWLLLAFTLIVGRWP